MADGIIQPMNTLTVKIPESLEHELAVLTQREHLSKSEVVRRALALYIRHDPKLGAPVVSALERAGELVGCFSGGPDDLSCNPDHMEGYGY